jgi:SAM-dependent methyltransferase
MSAEHVIWHDLEHGSYGEDLALWRELAAQEGSPILELGAGTGRVALELARRGYEVVALDTDEALLAELERRAEGLPIKTALADARDFTLEQRFSLCLVPMQTIQLLGGLPGRAALLERVYEHLNPGGLLAAALSPVLSEYEVADGAPAPFPDVCERDGVVYFSHPTGVYVESAGYVLERRRERVASSGERVVQHDRITLDHLDAGELEREGAAHGFTAVGRASIPATVDYAGSAVVMLRA